MIDKTAIVIRRKRIRRADKTSLMLSPTTLITHRAIRYTPKTIPNLA